MSIHQDSRFTAKTQDFEKQDAPTVHSPVKLAVRAEALDGQKRSCA